MTLAKDVLDKVKEQKEKDGIATIIEKSQGNLPAAIVGGGVGLLISYTKGYSLLAGFIIGAVATGLAANYLIKRGN